VELTDLIKD